MLGNRTVRDLRRHNRSTLLSALYLGDPCSRQDLVGSTGLSQGTVSTVVGELVGEGLVIEAGLVDSDGGRPRVLLRVNPGYAHVIGIDVGETRVRTELFDLAMRPLATVDAALASPRPAPESVAEQVLAGMDEVLRRAAVPPAGVLGVGIGVFGTVEQGPEAIVHAQTIGWDAVPLERLVRPGTSLPIYLENGAKTLGQAEMWFGAGRGVRHAVIALIGSGVGAAVVTNGSTYRGATSSAGEWGHTTLVYDGRPCRCGSRGCLEAYVGAEGVLDRYRQARRRAVPGADEESALAGLLAAAAHNPTAARVVEETVGYLGAGLAGLVNLFNPELIVLAGWAGHALGAELLPRIRAAAGERALRHPFGQTTITLGRLGPDAVALGAATLPVADLLARGAAEPRQRLPEPA
jgi:predicted NBD/HSP70 family sugar kinase